MWSDPVDKQRARHEVMRRLFGSEETTRVGRFEIGERLGTGGMGTVYRATDPKLGRQVALKLLHPSIAEGDDERLLREARGLARLTHPNVVAVYEVGTHEGQLFVAMELVEGQTLREWLAAAPRSWQSVLDVMRGAAQGLAAIHEAGLVHRDVKPENVLVEKTGRARIADFGLVRAGDDAPPSARPASEADRLAALTQTGALMGTPLYMSPEQLAGRQADERSDQFAFCATLYEALYGQRAFRGHNIVELALATATGAVEPPPPDNGVPDDVAAAVRRGLSPAAEERFESMAALLAALSATPAPNRRRTALVAFLAALAAAATMAAWRPWREPRPLELGPPVMASLAPTRWSAPDLVAARRLHAEGRWQACIERTSRGRRSKPLIALWLRCAWAAEQWPQVLRACRAHEEQFDREPLLECGAAMLTTYELLAKQRWQDCLDWVDEQPMQSVALRAALTCAYRAHDRARYAAVCDKMEGHYPQHPAVRTCRDALNLWPLGGRPRWPSSPPLH